MGVVKKAFKAIGLAPETPRIEAAKVQAEDVTLGQDDDTTTTSRGKRGLVRPVASSLGV